MVEEFLKAKEFASKLVIWVFSGAKITNLMLDLKNPKWRIQLLIEFVEHIS